MCDVYSMYVFIYSCFVCCMLCVGRVCCVCVWDRCVTYVVCMCLGTCVLYVVG